MEAVIPACKISALSSGQFVGMVADDPQNNIELNAFHSEILNDHEALKRETNDYVDIPEIRKVSNEAVNSSFLQIKLGISAL